MERTCFFAARLAAAQGRVYTMLMCKPIRDYLSLLRDYTREIITFGGFCLMCFVYNDFRQLAQGQAATAAQTVEVLRAMDGRLAAIERHSAPAISTPTATTLHP